MIDLIIVWGVLLVTFCVVAPLAYPTDRSKRLREEQDEL